MRENPKFLLVWIIARTREVVLTAGRTLVKNGRLDRVDDVFLLSFDELLALLGDDTGLPPDAVATRRHALNRAANVRPPRVITSDGEVITTQLSQHDLPTDALPGSGASAGSVEGLARVITDPSAQTLRPGEILVAPHTDPAWTPLFMIAGGLVMEIGGLMTHGSVVAREYGIPAVVCVTGQSVSTARMGSSRSSMARSLYSRSRSAANRRGHQQLTAQAPKAGCPAAK